MARDPNWRTNRAQERMAAGKNVRSGLMEKTAIAETQKRREELAKPVTRADYREGWEAATADVGALGQGQMVGQMALPGQMAGKFVEAANQRQAALGEEVLKTAVSEVELREQIAAQKEAAEKARLLQLMALKKSGRKQAAGVVAGLTTV